MASRRPAAAGFRLARAARTRYGLADLTLDAERASARTIAARVNAVRAAAARAGEAPGGAPRAGGPAPSAALSGGASAGASATEAAEPSAAARPIAAGELLAAGLLVSILGRVVDIYASDVDPAAFPEAVGWLDRRLGADPPRAVERTFVSAFPARLDEPEPVDRQQVPAQLLLLGALDANPAVEPFRELVDPTPVRADSPLDPVDNELAAFFATRPRIGPENRSLPELLRQPAEAAPGSLADQLRWIREHWTGLFGDALDDLLDKILTALDVLAEERMAAERAWFRFHDAGAGGPAEVYEYSAEVAEIERYSPDLDWMPRVVLMAKSTYVWLDQLSRSYGRDIHTLDAIPDEELDTFARWGITGLWLIGLWQRSVASERIKRMRGDHAAVASAYSLDDYTIAADLGGEAALHDLAVRAGARGIRVASDMVPNHMGIDSRWMIEHPERFLSLPDSPFPAYTFDGADLSPDDRVGIFIDDHYYDATDAAVVFKRLDRATGDVRYVYHGNDGTSYPWNDTAQLDYSRKAVREAVIQAILAVARRFPIIRFDAAMVLVKRHIQRLWFPEPGHGGAIPSRAGLGMTRAEFDEMMPLEFWREVVDRVAAEVPDTLLLAEAFWLLEGYFVRTLGMHRVYNSAFMNMLRDERNAEYRLVIRNTLEFDPGILGRFVNFMSNPDERTAVDQFGTGERYFGVAALMATMPGLPMFGHGQVEGFGERYGMDFRRARLDETVDEGLRAHHERTIFPLLHRRAQFAGSDAFRLYDVVSDDGSVNEDVFAYSNVGPRGERSLVVFHNRYAETAGRIRESVGFMARDPDGDRRLQHESLSAALRLSGDADRFVRMRDAMTGLEHLRSSAEIAGDGLRIELSAFRCHVFVDLAEMVDGPRPVARLAAELGGRGIPSIDEALTLIELEPVHARVREELAAAFAVVSKPVEAAAPVMAAGAPVVAAAPTGAGVAGAPGEAVFVAAAVRALDGAPFDEQRLWPVVRDMLGTAPTGIKSPGADPTSEATSLDRATRVVRGLVLAPARLRGLDDASVAAWLADPSIRDALGVHQADGVEWFDRDAFELLVAVVVRLAPPPAQGPASAAVRRETRLRAIAAESGYRVDRLATAIQPLRAKGRSRPASQARAAADGATPRRVTNRPGAPRKPPRA